MAKQEPRSLALLLCRAKLRPAFSHIELTPISIARPPESEGCDPDLSGQHFESAAVKLNRTNKELEANTTLSHYRIISKIGAGGMGKVYLALDTKLDRNVALKILPAEFASNQDRMLRFVQE